MYSGSSEDEELSAEEVSQRSKASRGKGKGKQATAKGQRQQRQPQQRRNEYSSGDDSSESDDDTGVALNKFSQMLLQAVQAIGILDVQQMKDLVLGIMRETNEVDDDSAEDVNQEFIQKRIDKINEAINPLDMTIRKVVCEISETTLYMFYVTIENPMLKFQTSFTPYEVELFKNGLKMILAKEDFRASLADLMQCANEIKLENVKAKTHSQLCKILEKFIALKYLVVCAEDEDEGQDQNGADSQIALGPRAIRELEPFIQDVYRNVVGNCCLCKSLIVNGLKCGNCDSDFHQHCFKAYIETTKQCPNPTCKTELADLGNLPRRTGAKPQAEEDSKMDEDVENGASSSGDERNGNGNGANQSMSSDSD